MDPSDVFRRLAREVRDAQTYEDAINYLFDDDVINFGRLSVWYVFSKQLYTILPAKERSKMNTIFKKIWWTLFEKGTLSHKTILLILFCGWMWC